MYRNGSADFSIFSEICADSLKALQSQGVTFVCQRTPTLKAAGSNPVGRTKILCKLNIYTGFCFQIVPVFECRFDHYSVLRAVRLSYETLSDIQSPLERFAGGLFVLVEGVSIDVQRG